MRTFLVLALAVILGPHVTGEQRRESANPCVERGNQHPQLLPVDEAASRSDFFAYRTRLRTAVERRDVEGVANALDPNIKLDFGGTGGAVAFRKLVAEAPETWEKLRTVLALGGSFTGPDLFTAPYVYSRWPDAFDAFECAAIVGRNVRVRSAPRLDAAVVTMSSYSIVRLPNGTEDVSGWIRVRLGDGRAGFVSRPYVRTSIDYRALFNLIDGRWRMTAFVAGD